MSIDLKIYIATHKHFDPPKEKFYFPIQVGRAGKEDLGYLGDHTGDSISEKNQNYCELTALYWAWKNSDSSFVGLCHYRRYFDSQHTLGTINDLRIISQEAFKKQSFSEEQIGKYLKRFEVILPKPKVYYLSVEKIYGYSHSAIDFRILTEVLEEMYPEYKKSWEKVTSFNNKLIHYNMFITSKEIVDAYCSWLFPLLFEVEKRVKISPYDYDKRVFGFMSERLMHLYFTHNKFKIKFLPVLYVKDETDQLKTPSKVIQFLTNTYKEFLFFLLNFPKKIGRSYTMKE